MEKLNIRWKSALKKAKIDDFHMKDFENRKNVYANWSNSKRIATLQRFHKIINDHMMYGCVSIVNCNDFDTIVKPNKFLSNYFHKTYYGFDVQSCIIGMNEWCNKNNIKDEINYFFAHLNKQGGVLDDMFNLMLSTPGLRKKHRVGAAWSKGLAKDFPPLQAADIIAYEINKRAANHMGKGEDFVRKSLDNLNLTKNFDPLYFGKQEIIKWIESDIPGFKFSV